MTVKASISLTDAQDAYVRSLVEGGRYPSPIRSRAGEGAILCFEIGGDVRSVRVFAVLLAGQEHRRRMLLRAVMGTGR